MLEKVSKMHAPGKDVPYVLKDGEGKCLLVAGQAIRILAGTYETAGGYGAVVCDATYDRQAIPLHYHEHEHDTWLCTRGRLRVWANDQSRILTEGDFAYVKPYDVHSYQSVAPRTTFFGIVAPGGWEGFFDTAGEEWGEAGLPPENHPYDFSRMGPAMGKYRVMRVEDATYADVTNGDESDRALPSAPASYVLQSGYGLIRRLNGHLSTVMLSNAITEGSLDMRTIEAGRGAEMPELSHSSTHVSLYVMSGTLQLRLGGEEHLLHSGDFANIPAGTAYATRVEAGHARWVLSSANGNGQEFWDKAGAETHEYVFENRGDVEACKAAISALDGIDVKLT